MTFCIVYVCVFLADIHVCLPSQFKCTSPSRCIPGIFRCNGQDNCGEGEDEKDCRELIYITFLNFFILFVKCFRSETSFVLVAQCICVCVLLEKKSFIRRACLECSELPVCVWLVFNNMTAYIVFNLC